MFWRSVLFLISSLLLAGISGCESGSDFGPTRTRDTAQTPLYSMYVCSSVGVSSQSGHTYRSGIFGARRGQEEEFETILNLDGDDNLIDSCAVDSHGNLYWTNRGKNGIFKADPNGANPRQIVFGLDVPFGLAIDETHQRIYWANWVQGKNTQTGQIGYADLEGHNPKTIVDSLRSGGDILVDPTNGKLYISDLMGGKILRCNLDGSALSTFVTANQPEQMALDFAHNTLYWADIADDALYRVNLDGSGKQTVIAFGDEFANPSVLALENNRLLFNIRANVNGNTTEVLRSFDLQSHAQQTVSTHLPFAAQKIILK